MTQAEVNWRELKEGERVKVEFEATVEKIFKDGSGVGFEEAYWVGHVSALDAAKITRIERPWKVGDRFERNTEAWEVIADWRDTNHSGPVLPCWNREYGVIGFPTHVLSTVTRLEPSHAN
jgi:hypothetical protein